jgi:hypothetical protein
MAFTWPEFAEPGWTATFDSYDQYREWIYYKVVILDGDQPVGTVMAQVSTPVFDDWREPGFTAELRSHIARVAEAALAARE